MLTREKFHEILVEAEELGYASAPVCATHEGLPHTDAEDEEFTEGYDPCVAAIRIYDE